MKTLRFETIQVSAVTGVWRFLQFRQQEHASIKFKAGHVFVHSLSFTVMLPLDSIRTVILYKIQ
jgi:hypothetical protein